MNKMDERILVFSYCMGRYLEGIPGLATCSMYPENFNSFMRNVLPTSFLIRRGDAEDDSSLQQIIPYVALVNADGEVLLYNRGNAGGEDRLANKWSLGFGGHINEEDMKTANVSDILIQAMRRELTEELTGLPLEHLEDRLTFLGFLDLDDSPVNTVHFGLLYKLSCDQLERIAPSSEIAKVKVVHIRNTGTFELESWSQHLRDLLR